MMKKIYLLLLMLFFPIINLGAVSSSDVDYEVKKLYINSEIEIAGAVRFKEIIEITGTYNGYIRDLVYKNDNLKSFTGSKEDFYGSDIYNGSDVIINKVGILKTDDFEYENFTSEYIEKNVNFFDKEGTGTYEVSEINNGKSLKMYNETINGSTYFYIEYTVTDLIVEHNDCAEFYYNIIGSGFEDDIEEVIAILYLPYPDKDNLKVWAHGPLTGEVIKDEDGYGAILKINNLSAYTPVDLRITYSKEQLMINLNEKKKSNMDALPLILEVEEERANEANNQRETAKKAVSALKISSTVYLLGLIGASVFVYLKYDKEHKSSFTNKYNREFIEDYDVEVIDYLMKQNTGPNAFSASILNLIYKKKISVSKIDGKKEDYIFTLLNKDNISEAEGKIIELLFETIGSDNEVKMSEIKSASKSNGASNEVYQTFNSWKSIVNTNGVNQGFFESHSKIKLLFGIYSVVGFYLGYLGVQYGMEGLPTLTIIAAVIFLLYILKFTKRSVKGNEHYVKWKAFKNFLEDFGRFQEKELPEIVLWERYLVYATVFGIADKVSKTMKVKFEEMNVNDNSFSDPLFNYYMLTNINRDISRSITESVHNSISTVQAAQSKSSSGSGFGGGFSSGGGFGGGGGGGRGF